MGNLCLCCYTRRESLKTQFSIEDLRQIDLPKANGKCYPKTLEVKIDATEAEKVSPVTVIPKTPSLTSADITDNILANNTLSSPIQNDKLLKEKDVLPISRALSAPMLHDTSEMIEKDLKGPKTEEMSRKFNDSSGDEKSGESETEVNLTEENSESESFVLPSSPNEVSPKLENSRTEHSASSYSTLDRSKSDRANDALRSMATMGAVYSIMESRQHTTAMKVSESNSSKSGSKRKIIRPLRPIVRGTNSTDKRGKGRHKMGTSTGKSTTKSATKKKM